MSARLPGALMKLFISWEFHLNETDHAYLAVQLYPFLKEQITGSY